MAALLLLAAALPALAGCVLNPVTGGKEFSLVSPGEEIRLGSELYPVYTQSSNGLFQDRALQEYVASMGRELAAVSHRPDLPYEFNVVNLSAPNAWALPGGKISVTRGMISLLEDEAQLAALLAHEIAHVTARHSAAAMTKQTLAQVLLGLGAAAASSPEDRELFTGVAGLATSLVLLKYSRDQERQADSLGIGYTAAAGYRPNGAVELMEILLALEDREPGLLETFFSSHPLTSERLAAARDDAARYAAAPGTRRSESRFASAVRRVKSTREAYSKADEGLLLLGKNQPNQARRLLEEAVREAPGEALLHVYLAAGELSARNQRGAERAISQGLLLYQDLFLARLVAGNVKLAGRAFREALEHLRTALGLVPDHADALFLGGRCHEELGERGEAARWFTRLLGTAERETAQTAYARHRLREWGYLP